VTAISLKKRKAERETKKETGNLEGNVKHIKMLKLTLNSRGISNFDFLSGACLCYLTFPKLIFIISKN
jgi:hypothetical protein